MHRSTRRQNITQDVKNAYLITIMYACCPYDLLSAPQNKDYRNVIFLHRFDLLSSLVIRFHEVFRQGGGGPFYGATTSPVCTYDNYSILSDEGAPLGPRWSRRWSYRPVSTHKPLIICLTLPQLYPPYSCFHNTVRCLVKLCNSK